MATLGKLPENLFPSSFKTLKVPPKSATDSDNSPVNVLFDKTNSVKKGSANNSSGMPPDIRVPVMCSRTKFTACPTADERVPFMFVLPPRYRF